ncbi:MAG: hypothetical protein ACI9TP_000100 [Candidatus Azotimanducaceae bacterium]|jgi:hypothetical protein
MTLYSLRKAYRHSLRRLSCYPLSTPLFLALSLQLRRFVYQQFE